MDCPGLGGPGLGYPTVLVQICVDEGENNSLPLCPGPCDMCLRCHVLCYHAHISHPGPSLGCGRFVQTPRTPPAYRPGKGVGSYNHHVAQCAHVAFTWDGHVVHSPTSGETNVLAH